MRVHANFSTSWHRNELLVALLAFMKETVRTLHSHIRSSNGMMSLTVRKPSAVRLAFDRPYLSLSICVSLTLCLQSSRPAADLRPYPTTCRQAAHVHLCPLIKHIHCLSGHCSFYIFHIFQTNFLACACTTCALIRRRPAKQIWCCFPQHVIWGH